MTQYACHIPLPEHPGQAAAEHIARGWLADAARNEGIRLDMTTLAVTIHERARVDGQPMLTREEEAAGFTGDEVMVRAAADVAGDL